MSLFLIDAGTASRPSAERVRLISAELSKRDYAHYLVGFDGAAKVEGAGRGPAAGPLRLGGGPSFIVKQRLVRQLKKRRAGLVHIVGVEKAVLVLAAAVKAEVPVKVLSLRQGESSSSIRSSLGAIDGIVVPSEGMKDIVARGGFPAANIEIVPPAMDFSGLQTAENGNSLRDTFHYSQGDFLVGVVGHLADQKTLQTILDAAEAIGKRVTDVRVIIFGDGDLNLEARDGSDGPRASNVQYYLGFDKNMPGVMASLDAFVIFSHLEGLGTRIIQAMALGVPVIAAEIRSVPDVVIHRNTGLLVPPRDAEALKEAVLKYYFDKAFAARLAQAGKEAVYAAYSDASVARRMVAFYERLAERKKVKLG